MAFVSVTRLRVRSVRYYPGFVVAAFRIRSQAQHAPGFVAGCLPVEIPLAFWTLTMWQDVEAMRAFRNHAPHLPAMAKLLHWCDEVAYVHWETPDATVPSLDEMYERLRDGGKTSKVRHPSPAHEAGRTVSASRPRPNRVFTAAR